jgi:hypothetical protein
MSAQAEEVVASASTMADMAAQLESLAGRFKLGADSGMSRGAPGALPVPTDERPRWAA